MENLLDLEPVYERICKIRVKLKYYSLALTSTHVPIDEKDYVAQKKNIVLWGRYVMQFPNYDIKKYSGTSMPQLELGPIYIQHVEGTAFTAKQTIMENEW